MSRQYATDTQYADWLGLAAPPTGADRALVAASEIIDEMLFDAVYDVDTDKLPTDTDVALTMQNATCAQAQYGRANGDVEAVGGGQVTDFTLGSLSVKKGGPAAGGASSAGAYPPHWSPRAVRILQVAGMLSYGPQGY